jgi:hypothetical protein
VNLGEDVLDWCTTVVMGVSAQSRLLQPPHFRADGRAKNTDRKYQETKELAEINGAGRMEYLDGEYTVLVSKMRGTIKKGR